MSSHYRTPGVYVEEVSSTVPPIIGASTSVAAFVGFFTRGPLNTAVLVTSMREFETLFGGLHPESEAGYGIMQFFANGGMSTWVVRVANGSSGSLDRQAPSYAAAQTTISTNATGDPAPADRTFTVYAANPGRWGNGVEIALQQAEPAPGAPPGSPSRFNLLVREVTTPHDGGGQITAQERHYNLTLDETDPRYAVNVINEDSNLISFGVDPVGTDDPFQPPTPYVPGYRPDPTNLADAGAELAPSNWTSLSGGADGDLPTALDLVPEEPTSNGIYALREIEPAPFNILCIPALAQDLSATSPRSEAFTRALRFCADHRAMMIVDIPEAVQTTAEMESWMGVYGDATASAAAVYFPRLLVPDPLDDLKPRNVAPSGTLAGIFARTDNDRGVWKAPAGTDAVLEGVEIVPVSSESGPRLPNDEDSGVLNPLGCNVLRSFPIYGNVCWGARTMAGADLADSTFKYINVRRLTDFVEQSLMQGLRWVVFEPNDEATWASIRLSAGSFLSALFADGAFAGSSPDQAFSVRCDATTTTQADIDEGFVNVVVGFAPVRPAEFVIITIRQLAASSQP